MARLRTALKALAARMGLGDPREELAARLDAKRTAWFSTPDARGGVKTIAALASDKLVMRRYVSSLGLRLPAIYCDVEGLHAIDFASLPERIVIKPHNGWDCDAVMLIDGERELLSGTTVPRVALGEFCRNTLAAAKHARHFRVIVEELIQDYDGRFAVPRDFKVFVAGGRARIVQVIDRNGPNARHSHSFYSREWKRFDDAFQTYNLPGPSFPRPPLLPQLLMAADRVASDLGAFLRLDFYLAADGPVFGEITWSPANGRGFTRFGSRYLCRLMDRYPDRIRGDVLVD